jgi:hypothetical protein
MTIPYIELDCPDYEEINAEIIDYLKYRTNILTLDPDSNIPYPNFVNNVDFVKHNPKLMEYFFKLGIKLFQVYYAVAFKPTKDNGPSPFTEYANPAAVSSCSIHLDRPPVQWKMNWPVLNMNDTGVRFYKLKNANDNIKDYVVRTGIPDSLDRDVWLLPYEPFDESHRHIFRSAPILMNGLVPHDVWFNPDIPMPRIGLQIMFFKEPRHLLNNNCIVLED